VSITSTSAGAATLTIDTTTPMTAVIAYPNALECPGMRPAAPLWPAS
jgi:hypothetical protein